MIILSNHVCNCAELLLDSPSYYTNWNQEYPGKHQSTTYANALSYNGSLGDHTYSVTATFDYFHKKEYDSYDPIYEQSNKYWSYGIEAQDTWFLNDYNTITFGGEYKIIDQDDKGGSFDENNISNIKNYAFYLQDEISLFDDKLLIIPAIRYDHSSVFGGEFSPKIGATWKITDDHRFKATYGYGYRAPTVSEYASDNVAPGYTYSELKPESSVGWDVTYEGEYKNLFGSITYFQSNTEDLIMRNRIQDGGQYYVWSLLFG